MTFGQNVKSPDFDSYEAGLLRPCPAATDSEVQPENYALEGLLRRELTFTPMPKENVLRTLYTLRLYPARKSSERVRL
jgi:hypothetical protein